MEINVQQAPWGMFMIAIMYVVGNGVWMNHAVRSRTWLGWIFWAFAGVIVLSVGATLEGKLDGQATDIWTRLTSVDPENHWIMLGFFAVMSVPGAGTVLFHQNDFWTRVATVGTALLVFIPTGISLGSQTGNVTMGVIYALAVTGFVLAWQVLLDDATLDPKVKD